MDPFEAIAFDPYAPPESPLPRPEQPDRSRYGSPGRRLADWLVDYVL